MFPFCLQVVIYLFKLRIKATSHEVNYFDFALLLPLSIVTVKSVSSLI